MINSHWRLLIVATLSWLVCLPPAAGTTNCVQHFTVMGKSRGVHCLLLVEDFVSGECESHYLHSILLGLSRPFTAEVGARTSWQDDADKLLADMGAEPMIAVSDSGGRYFLSESTWVAPPPVDTTFLKKFSAMANDGNGYPRAWYRECPVGCTDYPVFSGVEIELAYEFKGGIYKNYSFSDVLFFPESGYLVLVVNQPILADGLDSMHGFFVYRIKGNKP